MYSVMWICGNSWAGRSASRGSDGQILASKDLCILRSVGCGPMTASYRSQIICCCCCRFYCWETSNNNEAFEVVVIMAFFKQVRYDFAP